MPIIEGKQKMLASEPERCSKDRLAILLCAATVLLSFQLEGSSAIHRSPRYGNRVSDLRSHKPGSMDVAASTNAPCLSDASSALPLVLSSSSGMWVTRVCCETLGPWASSMFFLGRRVCAARTWALEFQTYLRLRHARRQHLAKSCSSQALAVCYLVV